MKGREELLREIACEEARLAALQAEAEECAARLATLRDRMPAEQPAQRVISLDDSPVRSPAMTNAAKVALFRTLFRGREDVFPHRWENSTSGKSGYSPTCSNEWDIDQCAKKKRRGTGRRTTCGDCRHQAFIPVSDEEIVKHLRGEQVMGVYPLLPDETCWFLAADFDKKEWQTDITAFAETCALHGVPMAVERSRSGDGAHAWIFFSAPVPAATARRLGCFLITETMARRHQLSMESYDRLFPNQDTIPRGGFGNLIALPLQRPAREMGNSVFVDADFSPWPDQWDFLSGVDRIDGTTVHALVHEASRRGLVVGVRLWESGEEEESEPWTRPPSWVFRLNLATDSGSIRPLIPAESGHPFRPNLATDSGSIRPPLVGAS